jgi:hypothetical protein
MSKARGALENVNGHDCWIMFARAGQGCRTPNIGAQIPA